MLHHGGAFFHPAPTARWEIPTDQTIQCNASARLAFKACKQRNRFANGSPFREPEEDRIQPFFSNVEETP
jgi:hypothetical protein